MMGRVVMTGNQPTLERLWNKRAEKLEGFVAPARLVDRRPVAMVPSTTVYQPERKARKTDKRVAYSLGILNDSQRRCMTNTTKGEDMDMKNGVSDGAQQRLAMFMARKAAEEANR